MAYERRVATLAGSAALALAAWLPAANVFAQTATTTPTAQNAGEGDQLAEVVVTAERRATDVLTTPISVQAVSGET